MIKQKFSADFRLRHSLSIQIGWKIRAPNQRTHIHRIVKSCWNFSLYDSAQSVECLGVHVAKLDNRKVGVGLQYLHKANPMTSPKVRSTSPEPHRATLDPTGTRSANSGSLDVFRVARTLCKPTVPIHLLEHNWHDEIKPTQYTLVKWIC